MPGFVSDRPSFGNGARRSAKSATGNLLGINCRVAALALQSLIAAAERLYDLESRESPALTLTTDASELLQALEGLLKEIPDSGFRVGDP